MKRYIKVIIPAVAVVILSAVVLYIYDVHPFGIPADKIEQDARESQQVNEDYEVSKAVGDELAALLFYDESLEKHTFSVYQNGDGIFGYQFYAGGSDGIIDEGIGVFKLKDGEEKALLSMNRKHAIKLEYKDEKVDINPQKPFVLILPAGISAKLTYANGTFEYIRE